jgi:hypothetical protein
MSEWQPIETAPKGKGEILVIANLHSRDMDRHVAHLVHWMPSGHCIEDHPPIEGGWYRWNGCEFVTCSPIWWMPLPSPPGEKP